MTTLLMTLDAVGGVWRYAMDLGRGLRGRGYRLAFAGFGPPPPAAARAEAEALGPLDWCEAPLEWMVQDPGALGGVGPQIAAAAARHGAGLLHLNLPGQAAGLDGRLPVVAVCHSCLATWFAAVRGTALPADWAWQGRMTRAGLRAADAVVAPSRAHAEAMRACHGAIARLDVVHNAAPAAVAAAAAAAAQPGTPRPLVAAAGRCRIPRCWRCCRGRGSSSRPRATSRSGWRRSRRQRAACRWCCPTSPPTASSGTARRCSSRRAMRPGWRRRRTG
jgi:hypothetical protein